MQEMINLKIDGIDVEVPKGTTILQAAKKANIDKVLKYVDWVC